MPIIKSAKKALRKSVRQKAVNLKHKEAFKGAVKKIKKAIKEKNKDLALSALPLVYKELDKAAKTGVIKKNSASRKKSRLTRFLNSSFK